VDKHDQHATGVKTYVTAKYEGVLPPKHSFVAIDGENLIISALKGAEDNEGIIVRFWNSSEVTNEAKISLPKMKSASIVNFLEKEKGELSVDNCL